MSCLPYRISPPGQSPPLRRDAILKMYQAGLDLAVEVDAELLDAVTITKTEMKGGQGRGTARDRDTAAQGRMRSVLADMTIDHTVDQAAFTRFSKKVLL